MLVAEIFITEGHFLEAPPSSHAVGFDDLHAANAEYDRIAALLLAKNERKNDLPAILECEGSTGKVSIALGAVRAVSILDYEKMNEQRKGLRDTFPNVFSKP